MTAPPGGGLDGGKIDVEVRGDTTGFAKDLKAQIEARTKNIKAKIQATVDAKRLATELRIATRAAEKTAQIKVKLGVDSAHLGRELRKALTQATRDAGGFKVKIGVDLDDRQLQRTIDQATRNRKVRIGVDVDADTAPANREVDGFRARQSRKPVTVPVKIESTSLSKAANALTKIGSPMLLVGGFQMLASAVTGAGAALVAFVSAAAPAAGVIGALPGLIGVAVQGIGALVAGFSGIGDAVSAMGKAETAGASSAASSAKAREAAADRIADAQKRVQKAYQSADRTAADGARAVAAARQRLADVQERSAASIVAAERSLQSAQRESKRAQEDLTRAREEARERLDDLGLSLRGAALDEEGAILSLERARERLNEVNTDPGSTDMDRREADLAFRQAQQRVAEIQESNADLQAEAEDAFAKGVDGADNVVAAQERVADANQGVADAEADLAKTRTDAARDVQDAQQDLALTIQDTAQANADAQEGIADAQEDLARAMRDAAEATDQTSASVSALNEAMDNLSPAGQRFAKFIADTLQPKLKDLRMAIQESMLPGVQLGVERALPLLDTLKTGLVGTGAVIGSFATDLGTMMGSDLFRADVGVIMESNNRALGSFSGTGLNLVSILKDLIFAAGPLIERFAAWTKTLTDGWAASIATAKSTGELTAWFNRAGDVAAQLGRIFGDLVATIWNIGGASQDTGKGLLDSLEAVVAKWREWTGSTEGQAKIQAFFEAMAPLGQKIAEIVGKVVEAFVLMGQNGGGSLGGFLDALGFMLDILNKILSSPLGPFISSLLTIAGMAGAFGLVAGKVLGIVDAVKGVGGGVTAVKDFVGGMRDSATAATDAATEARKYGAAIKTGASNLVSWVKNIKLANIATKAMAIAQGALNAVMAINPFVLIVIAIAALVAAFIWAWNNVDGFKEGVMKALGAVRDFIVAAWNWIKDLTMTVWNAITGFFTEAWDVIVGIFQAAVDAVQAVITFVWEAIKAYFTLWWTVVSTIFTTAIDAIKWVLETAWNVIKTVVETVWNAIKTVIETVWNVITSVFQGAIDVISGIWSAFWNALQAVGSAIFNAIAGAIEGILGTIRNSFEVAVNAISAVWDLLRAAIRAPIEFVVNVVYNQGIRPAWNWISGLFDGPQLPEAHFAKGGVLPGYRPGKDTIPAMLSPGEGILVPEATRALGGAQGIQAINAAYSSRVAAPSSGRGAGRQGKARQEDHGKRPGFFLGGIGDWIGDRWDDVTGWVGDVVSNISSKIADGWAVAVEWALKPFRGMADAMLPDNPIGTTMESGVNKMLDNVLYAVTNREKEEAAKAVAAAGPVGSGVAQWAGLVNQVLTELGQSTSLAPWVLKLIEHESGGNPNAINNWDSNAAAGHPSQGLMQTIPGTFNAYAGPYRSLGITNPKANIYAGLNYGISRYGSVANIPGIKSLMAGGAYKPYDTGGPWAPNTLGGNFSGQTEHVATGSGVTQLGHDVLQLLNSGGSLVDMIQRASPGTLAAGGNNIGVLIESGAIQLVWNGDKPNTTQETLNVGLRTLANMGLFNAGPGGT